MPWGFVCDIAAVVFIIWFVRRNKERKQLRCILETICLALAMVISVPAANALAALVYTRVFRAPLARDISGVVEQAAMLANPGSTDHISGLLAKLPSSITNAAESYNIVTEENSASISRIIVSSAADSAEQIVDILAAPIIQGIFRAVFCLIVFTGLQYLLKAVAALVENAMYSPERVDENVLLCGVLGAIKGMIVLSVALCVVKLILPALPVLPRLELNLLDGSFLCSMLYEHNPLLAFLGAGVYPTSLL